MENHFEMMVLFPNPTNCIIHYWAGKYKGKIGGLYSPDYFRQPNYYLPYAIDNGAWTGFDPHSFRNVLMQCRTIHKPLWVIVPDVVADPEITLKQWYEWKDEIASFGYPLAFACQNGHEPQDVPSEAYCCFVGGTTEWKLNNAHRFKGLSKWLHVGRVSTRSRLQWAEEIGADSCDGTGWFRGGINNQNNRQFNAIMEYFEGSSQQEMFR